MILMQIRRCQMESGVVVNLVLSNSMIHREENGSKLRGGSGHLSVLKDLPVDPADARLFSHSASISSRLFSSLRAAEPRELVRVNLAAINAQGVPRTQPTEKTALWNTTLRDRRLLLSNISSAASQPVR